MSPVPSLGAAGVGEALELAPSCRVPFRVQFGGGEERGSQPQLSPERARPLAAQSRNGAPEDRGILGSPHSPTSAPGARSREVFLSNITPGVRVPSSLNLPGLRCALAPRLRVPWGSLRGWGWGWEGVLAWEARWPSLPASSFSGLGDWRVAGGQSGSWHFGAPARPCLARSAPCSPGSAPRGRPGVRRQRCGPGWEGEELEIACSGTMPTFEPLTTKQTTLVLSLHCPNSVY